MGNTDTFGLTVLASAAAVGLALVYNRISTRTRIPAPAVFLLVAAVASNLFPTLAHVSVSAVQNVVTVALVIILFDGGMDIGWRQFRSAAGPVALIGVAGTFVTAAAIAALAHSLFGIDWLLALLLGTAVAPTDPAVVFSVLGRQEVAGRVGTILKGESGANDPVGIALMASLLAVMGTGTSGLSAVGTGLAEFALQMVIGTAVGLVGGGALLGGMRRWPLPSGALYPLRTLMGALAIYGLTTVAHGSGFLAVFIAGIVVGDAGAPYKREIERFHSALASLGEIVAFAVLGLTIDLTAIWGDGSLAVGLALAALLAFAVRPLFVGALLLMVRLRPGERVFLMWAGLKGAVPILLGTFALSSGVNDAHWIYDIIFVIVGFSVIVQGGLVPMVAKRLGVQMRTVEPEPFSLGVRFKEQPESLRRYLLRPGMPADGRRVRDLKHGEGVWISMVIRNGQLITVSGDTTLRAGDEIIALVAPDTDDDLGTLFETTRTGPTDASGDAKDT